MNASDLFAKSSKALLYLSAVGLVAVLVVAAFNPGCTNVDTLDQWWQAHAKFFHNWHSMALTVTMTYLIRVHDGFQPVIVLQVLLFAAGILLAITKDFTPPLLAVSLLLISCLVPPVFYWLGFVGVDPFMACWLILAVGAICRYRESGRRPFFWLAIISLYFGFWARHNGVFAVLPLLALLFLRRPLLRSSLKIVLVLLCFVGLLKLTDAIYGVHRDYPEQAGFSYDLAALSVRSGAVLIPPEFQKPGISLPAIQKMLDPYNDASLFWGPESVIKLTASPADMRDLERSWISALIAHPEKYLAWRLEYFSKYLGLAAVELEPIIETCIATNEVGLVSVDSRLHTWTMRHLTRIDQSILFRPYLYLAILLLFLIQGFWLKRWDTVWIAVAGIAYGLGYFIFGQSGNFRLTCFSNFAAVLLIVRLIAERVSAARAESKATVRISPAWYLVASVLMLILMVKIVQLAQPPRTVLAGRVALRNLNFEDGSIAPWQPYQDVHVKVLSAKKHDGEYGLAETDNPGSVYQDVTGLEPGKRYRVVAYVASSPGATAPAQVAVWDPATNVATYSGTITPTPTWQLIGLTTRASTTGTLRVHLFRQHGTGTVYWDDVNLYPEE
jgi:hypothetical protein